MIDLTKYSELEVLAAIRVVEEILDVEDFNIDIRTGTSVDAQNLFDNSVVGENLFCFIDRQGAYLGDIDAELFTNLGGMIDRTEIYHNDSFYGDYEDRVAADEEIPQDDWDRKILIFLESEYCQELLMSIDVETYQTYKDKIFDDLNLTQGIKEHYIKDGKFDDVGFIIDKSIGLSIMETQSAYSVIEHNGLIYELYNNDNPGIVLEFEEALEKCDVSDFDFASYETFADLINGQKGLLRDDMNNLGAYDDNYNWDFYLSEYELEYIGLGEELEKAKIQLDAELALVDADDDKFVDEIIADVVERSQATIGAPKYDIGLEEPEFE